MATTVRDPNTLSNYGSWLTKHTTATLTIDFNGKLLNGQVEHELISRTGNQSREIVLDSSYVAVKSVKLGGSEVKWELKDRVLPYGSPLHIALPEGEATGEGDVVKLNIELSTTEACTALQWLTKEQTSNRKHPYMFTQCQAIHARSLFPCQDTPDVKSTYSFNITSALPVVASGILKETADAGEGKTLYRFEQEIPIPSYLFALASGDIKTAPIGPRSRVATGPEELEGAKWELERDMEKFMEAAENIVFPYKWGEYNVLILPPSFPYGGRVSSGDGSKFSLTSVQGMENPVFSFVSDSVISGDRQNVDVVAHELAHSWSGNLVTNCSWEHFWLNEGWTVYLELRIGAAIHGEPQRDFSAIIGWKALEDDVALFGADHEYTKLIVNLKGADCDDAFSSIPYWKGFCALYYLEKLVGRDNFDRFIPHYFSTWAGKSLDSFEFKKTFLDFFEANGDEDVKKKIAAIDWQRLFYAPGLPPKPDFDTSYVDISIALSERWKDPVCPTPLLFVQRNRLALTQTTLQSPSHRPRPTSNPSPATKSSSSSKPSSDSIRPSPRSEPSFWATRTNSSPHRTSS
jgi:leukotriene-A4 hydrolase